MPVLNIPRAEFPLRSDSIFLLRESGLSQDYLLFRDEVDLHGLHKNKQLTLTLVDHNVLPRSVLANTRMQYYTILHFLIHKQCGFRVDTLHFHLNVG